MTPLSPQRFGFQFTGDQETHEEYEKFRARMSHEIPSGEMALVFKAALEIANAQLEKRKFAATDRPGRSRGSASPRCIPADVKRAVAERDQGKCAFVSESGKRCGSRSMLEFDHIEAARGGEILVLVDQGKRRQLSLIPGPGLGAGRLGGPVQRPAQVGHHALTGLHQPARHLGAGAIDEDAAQIQQHPGPPARELRDAGGQHLIQPPPLVLGGYREAVALDYRPLPAM